MTRLHRKRIHARLLRPGSVCGRMGLFAESLHMQHLLLERLNIAPPPDGGREEEKGPRKKTVPASEGQKKHVMAVLAKSGECGASEVAEFRAMHPGVRELRVENYLSSIWTNGEWKTRLDGLIAGGERLPNGLERADLIAEEMASVRAQIGDLCFALELGEATPEERKEALLRVGEATAFQSSFFPQGTRESLQELERRLDAAGNGNLRHFWRSAKPNIVSAASAAHKLRFTGAALSPDENSLLKTVLETDNPGKAERNMYSYAFTNDVSNFESILAGIVACTVSHCEPLLEAAKSSAEFDTLLHFLGKKTEHVTATLTRNPGFTKAHSPDTKKKAENEDALTSFKISVHGPDGIRSVALDVVFDGVSGQGGASIASRMAKDAVEIAVLAGWVRGPEDVRSATVLADLIIDINKKDLGHTDMGTTMTASYIEGGRFFGIHCGDSDWKVIRSGSVIRSSSPHGVGNRIWSGLGIGPRDIHINNRPGTDYQPIMLMDGDIVLTLTDGIGDVVCNHEYCMLAADYPSDILGLRDAIARLADTRKDLAGTYDLLCGCGQTGGKDDDMTIIARLISILGK